MYGKHINQLVFNKNSSNRLGDHRKVNFALLMDKAKYFSCENSRLANNMIQMTNFAYQDSCIK